MARTLPIRKILAAAALAVGALLIVAAVRLGPGVAEQARAGAGFGARIACSCHFVEGRPLGQCRDDFEPGMGLVRLSADEDSGEITASVPLLASTTVRYRKGWGCLPEDWEG